MPDLLPDTPSALRCGDRTLAFDRPRIMGILNVTPDSFSDGGRHAGVDGAVAHARRLVAEGADIVDVGGESTRPGATPVPIDEELERVVPIVERLVAELDTIVSIDTSRPEVMDAAAAAGAGLVNDVRALRADGALAVAAGTGLPVCLMHMRGEPATMQDAPRYDDPVEEVFAFLAERRDACLAAGIGADRVLVDPGFGFGKTFAHNLALLRGMERFATLGSVLAGLSRKGMIGALGETFGPAPADTSTGMASGMAAGAVVEAPGGTSDAGDVATARLQGSIVAALHAVRHGARIVRVHDVAPTRMALAVQHGIENH